MRFIIKRVTTVVPYIEDRDLGQVLQRLPLPADVVDGADDDDVLQLVVVEVGGPERHDEVPEQQLIMTNELIARSSTGSRCAPEPDEGAVRVSEEADDDVAVEDGHGGLLLVLRTVYNDNGNMM